ncbi:MAG: carbamoyl-phosphate synthase large subunit [Oscillospiraceae bacterium]|nr:carbamoyl-phosphate synthase large subunit [Oscillospiraceae bacterium]
MPKDTTIKKILVIGSGPIIIGQAAEFDYSGTQACLALKAAGYTVILINSNPATIMTDTDIADKVYMEPLTLEFVARIVRMERPDALLPTLGGQTGLNLAMQLATKGILDECQCRILGTDFSAIDRAEDREKFRELCVKIGEPTVESEIAHTLEETKRAANDIGYPVVLRPAFTLGGTGGGFANNDDELEELAKSALTLSPVSQVLVEKSIKGYKEIEFEVMRDAADTAIVICCMENVDPVGIHTGDSIVVCPSQTLTSKELSMLRRAALRIVRELGIEGGCNIQFALDPYSFKYFVIEVNPRVSRSSALASKASGYPIARVSALVSVGMLLQEIDISGIMACFEPSLDYVVTKIARFPFDKFRSATRSLFTQMKATGEVMALGRSFEESFLKAVRSLEIGVSHIWQEKFVDYSEQMLTEHLDTPTDERIFAIAELLRRGVNPLFVCEHTKIDLFFIKKIQSIVMYEQTIRDNFSDEVLLVAKRMGFSDAFIGKLISKTDSEVFCLRKEKGIMPQYKRIDSCAAEFDVHIPFYYSTYESKSDLIVTDTPSVIVLGAGPIRIGQGVEFDYSTVHAIKAIREEGYEAIIINNNPETVSTDYMVSDKLYFEPLVVEDVMNIIEAEKPLGVIVTLGGQTAINLADSLSKLNVPIMGTGVDAIARAENRDIFEHTLNKLNIKQPKGRAVTNIEDGIATAKEIGYPVLVRPSYVLGGRAMRIVSNDEQLKQYLSEAVLIDKNQPVLVDRYISGKEVEVDAVCDGTDVLIPGIMEHVERTGVHSGDSISVYPTFSISQEIKDIIVDYSIRLGLGIGINGPFNIQYIVDDQGEVYVIEVNPRSSRTVPFISKTTGVKLANIAAKVSLGYSLRSLGYTTEILEQKPDRWYVKVPVFSYQKLRGVDTLLSPEMKSTGEAIGYDSTLTRALYKGLQAAGLRVENYGTILVTVADEDKPNAAVLVKRFYDLGFNIEATEGTAEFLKKNDIRTRTRKKLSEGSDEIHEALKQGHIAYVINTVSPSGFSAVHDGFLIRRYAVENGVTAFTSLDTVEKLLDVLEEITIRVSTIDV